MTKWYKLSTPEGNIKGLQAAMNKLHALDNAAFIENCGKYASLASAMNSAQRLLMDREKFEWEKTEVATLRAEIDELKRQQGG